MQIMISSSGQLIINFINLFQHLCSVDAYLVDGLFVQDHSVEWNIGHSAVPDRLLLCVCSLHLCLSSWWSHQIQTCYCLNIDEQNCSDSMSLPPSGNGKFSYDFYHCSLYMRTWFRLRSECRWISPSISICCWTDSAVWFICHYNEDIPMKGMFALI